LLYNEKYQLTISDNNNHYDVYLSIPINQAIAHD